MSKMKLLLDVVSDLRSLADSLQAVADAVAQGGQEQMDQTTEEKPVQKPEKENYRKERGAANREGRAAVKAADIRTGAGGSGREVPCRSYGRGKGAPDQARCG